MIYNTAARTYYHGDKTHLKQPGHDLIGRGVADLVEAALRSAARGAWHAPGANLSHHRHAQASPQTEELCFLWYRSGLVDKLLDFVSTPSDADPALSCTTAPRKAPTHGKASGPAGCAAHCWRSTSLQPPSKASRQRSGVLATSPEVLAFATRFVTT